MIIRRRGGGGEEETRLTLISRKDVILPTLRPSLVLKDVRGIPAFIREFDDIPCNSWESVENGTFVPRKVVCCRVHVGK